MPPIHARSSVLRGTAFQRGAALARARLPSIQRLFEHKLCVYEAAGKLEAWRQLAEACRPWIERLAPVTFAELQGASSVMTEHRDIDDSLFWLLAVEYEMSLWEVAGSDNESRQGGAAACTGIGFPGLAGQTNDEDLEAFPFPGDDVMIAMVDGPQQNEEALDGLEEQAKFASEFAVLLYTHPGYPAYMGMNSCGLSVLWQYIDTGDRCNLFGESGGGVPTNVLIRELLAQRGLDDALALLRLVPKTVPNNFILTDRRQTVNVEVSPNPHSPGSCCVVGPLSGAADFVVHTNHVLFDEALKSRDVNRQELRPTFNTHARCEKMKQLVLGGAPAHSVSGLQSSEANRTITPFALENMLLTPPIFQDGTASPDVSNGWRTQGLMVFDSWNLSARVWFYPDADDATGSKVANEFSFQDLASSTKSEG